MRPFKTMELAGGIRNVDIPFPSLNADFYERDQKRRGKAVAFGIPLHMGIRSVMLSQTQPSSAARCSVSQAL
jgi:hypothetical protein